MKNRLLLFAMLFSFGLGFAQTDEKLSPEEQARRERNIQAGNPFKKFGYKPKIATLSKGKYLEFHDLDSIVKIGSYSYHVKKKQITGYNMHVDENSEATLRPELTSRWLSPDPLAEEFPSWSPYNFTMNNPVRYIDPDGRAPLDIIFTNNSGQEIGRIVTPGEDMYVEVDTDFTPPTPIVVDPIKTSEKLGIENPDAVGISFDYSGVVGGGLTGGVEFSLILEGEDAGNLYGFTKFGGGVGLDAEIGGAGTVSTFNDEANLSLFNAKGMEGKYSGYSAGLKLSGSYSWSNEDNRPELFPGHRSTTTWETYSLGGGFVGGEAGAKWFSGTSTLMNEGKPLLSLDLDEPK